MAKSKNIKTGGEIAEMVVEAARDAINMGAAKVMSEAVNRAPLGPGHAEGGDSLSGPSSLRESAHLSEATEHQLHAQISFNTPYAAAQHEGIAEMHRNGKIILWVVKHYTTPGTGKKYLEDPYKGFIPEFAPFVQKFIRARLEGRGVPGDIAAGVAGLLTIKP